MEKTEFSISLLKEIELFMEYTEEELNTICQKLEEETFQSGNLILNEGEIGDKLYLIVAGSVQVFTYDSEGHEIILARLEKGNYFGEQAIATATPMPRNASVRALTDVKTYTLSHKEFQKYMKKDKNLQKLLEEVGQKNLTSKFVEKLQENKEELGFLFDTVFTYEEREIFFRQGDDPDNAYFLISGLVAIRKYDENNKILFNEVVQPGLFFGELGVLEKKPREATAVSITRSQVSVVSSDLLQKLYEKNVKLQKFIETQKQMYEVPSLGLVIQHQGQFLDKPAIHTTIRKSNGDFINASKLIEKDIYSIAYLNQPQNREELFEKEETCSRTLFLNNHTLVGVLNVGPWDDLLEITKLVYEKVEISDEVLEKFRNTGRIEAASKAFFSGDIVCECMHVKVDVIQKLIQEGRTVEEISKETGAGTVCGGCKPRLIELAGGTGWIPVKIVEVIDHSDRVKSFILVPLQGHIPSSFKGGQHIVVEGNIQGNWIARSYTLTKSDQEKNCYEITVKKEGYFSSWLFDHCNENIQLRISPPQGEFVFQKQENLPGICLMAGIGITPAIAFARELIYLQGKIPLSIDYSARTKEEAIFQKELQIWANEYPNIEVNIRLTSEQGRIQKKDVQFLLQKYPEAEIYICGPKAYEKGIKEILQEYQIPERKIHSEEFISAGEPLASKK